MSQRFSLTIPYAELEALTSAERDHLVGLGADCEMSSAMDSGVTLSIVPWKAAILCALFRRKVWTCYNCNQSFAVTEEEWGRATFCPECRERFSMTEEET